MKAAEIARRMTATAPTNRNGIFDFFVIFDMAGLSKKESDRQCLHPNPHAWAGFAGAADSGARSREPLVPPDAIEMETGLMIFCSVHRVLVQSSPRVGSGSDIRA